MRKEFGKLKKKKSGGDSCKLWMINTNELDFLDEVGSGASAKVFYFSLNPLYSYLPCRYLKGSIEIKM